MKLCLLFLIPVLFACNAQLPPSSLLNQEELQVQSFSLSTNADTTITTAAGIKVDIPAHAFKAVNVTLVIKEALSLSDIIRSGLTTQTSKGVLSSGGMFYIGAKEEMLKPLQINIPTPYANENMKLYKGVDKNGRMEWADPQPLTTKISGSSR